LGEGVDEVQSHGGQQHPIQADAFRQELVVPVIPVPSVPQDWVGDVLEVPSDLVPATGQWVDLQPRESRSLEASK